MAENPWEGKSIKPAVVKAASVPVVALALGLLALIPNVGYKLNIELYRPYDTRYEWIDETEFLYAIVDFHADGVFSPLLYPMSWVLGKGILSHNFSMVYLPDWTWGTDPVSGERYTIPRWGKPQAVREEARTKVTLDELLINIPLLVAISTTLVLLIKHRIFLWLLGGVLGFAVAGLVGIVVGLSVGVISAQVVLPMLSRRRQGQKAAQTV